MTPFESAKYSDPVLGTTDGSGMFIFGLVPSVLWRPNSTKCFRLNTPVNERDKVEFSLEGLVTKQANLVNF